MKHAIIKTTLGTIIVELNDELAPKTVENFLNYLHKKHYDGTIFHRVIDGFMIQGGGFDKNMKQPATDAPIANEAQNGLKNDPYTLAMARTNDPHSATAQFFINVAGNAFLNHSSPTPQGWGYAVFGKVVTGQEVVDEIRRVKTTTKGFHQDVPKEPVVITEATEWDYEAQAPVVRQAAEPKVEEAAGAEAEYMPKYPTFANYCFKRGYAVTRHEVKGADPTVSIEVGDDRSEVSGANHRYVISGFNTETNVSESATDHSTELELLFQNGSPLDVGKNGVTLEAVLAACGHRLEGFQSGKFACDDNQEALDAINKAIEALQRRTKNRIARGVEGKHVA